MAGTVENLIFDNASIVKEIMKMLNEAKMLTYICEHLRPG
jgi:hypothetical protein